MKNPLYKTAAVIAALAVCIAGFSALFIHDGEIVLLGEEDSAVIAESSRDEDSSRIEETLTEEQEQETESATERESEVVTAPESTSWNLLLVNDRHPIPDGFENDLELDTIVDSYQADHRIIEYYAEMSSAAKQDGVDLIISSAYRSTARQTELFDGWKNDFMAEGMSEEDAEIAALAYTARPGTSEHQTGLALDIMTPEYQNMDEGYVETAAAKWLLENAAAYGFILRYPQDKESLTQVSFEPWHYRYVGAADAEIIMREGYCLEEYLRSEPEVPVDGETVSDAEPPEQTQPAAQLSLEEQVEILVNSGWITDLYGEHPIELLLSSNGSFMMLFHNAEDSGITGEYFIDGNQIFFTTETQVHPYTATQTFEVSGDTLILTTEDGTVTVYERWAY
jgi:D-alanyl-D-alanine carboxypeptidase